MRTEAQKRQSGLAPVASAPVSREVNVRAHELAPRIGDLESNLRMIGEAIRDAANDGVQLLVLPELATSGYYLLADEAKRCALPADHRIFDEWASLLNAEMVVVLGFCEHDRDTLHNSAAMITHDGVNAVYRKTHLWDEEHSIFEPGEAAAPIVQTPIGNLGVLICYDLEFPEMPRGLALSGAEIIAVPTNWPVVPRPVGEHPPEVIQAMAAARSSRVAIVCCDRAGTERGNDWTRGTSVVGNDGWLCGKRDDAGRLDTTITIAPERTQIGPRNHSINDRRPLIYAPPGDSAH